MIGVTGQMRAGFSQAIHHARHRSAFGKPLIDQPLMRNAWSNLGWNTYFDGAWKRLDPARAGVNLHMSADGAGQEFRFLRIEADGSKTHNVVTLGSKICAFNDASVGIGTDAPAGKLDVRGAIHAGGSDLYFTETTHTSRRT